MLNIDTETYMIEITRGDTATIVFSAIDSDGNQYSPKTGDKLSFAVAKKVGADPIFTVTNECGVDEDFWGIFLSSENTNKLAFKDYVYDVQIETTDDETGRTVVETIIGKTDTITPTLRVWGEVANESAEE